MGSTFSFFPILGLYLNLLTGSAVVVSSPPLSWKNKSSLSPVLFTDCRSHGCSWSREVFPLNYHSGEVACRLERLVYFCLPVRRINEIHMFFRIQSLI